MKAFLWLLGNLHVNRGYTVSRFRCVEALALSLGFDTALCSCVPRSLLFMKTRSRIYIMSGEEQQGEYSDG